LDIVNAAPPESDLNKLGSQTQREGDTTPVAIARENWRRYEYIKSRGHVEYMAQARRNEDFYLGGGLQWDPTVKQFMEEVEGRPASECNEIMGSVNAAIGYQIANRMDVNFVPASDDANPLTAKVLSIVVKNALDNARHKWHETQQFGDGLIAQRGYLDIRTRTDENIKAELVFSTIDPMDGIPDPDAKSYDPADWLDFTITRWLTANEVGSIYGPDAQAKLEAQARPKEGDFGDGTYDDGIWRNRFGDPRTTANEFTADLTDGSDVRYRIIDRQHHKYEWATVAVYPTGDTADISNASADELAALKRAGVLTTKRRIKRVRWTVSAMQDVLLFDDWSPWKTFTVVPFFPFFRRGRTRGMIDNAISPQETLNKAISQAIAITNTVANSGWQVEENSLTNMNTSDLESIGGSTGLIQEYAKGSTPPKKIEPNQVPTGITNLITVARENIKAVTGINESMLGIGNQDMSGVAIQSRQFAAQQQLALPLDNLSRTRHMVAEKVLEFVQKYMPDERVIRIAGGDLSEERSITVNQVQPDGSILHDLTLGKYDVVVSDQPMQITFDNSQFEQIKSLHETFGYIIPPKVALRYSNLPDKAEVGPLLEQANQPAPDPEAEASAALKNAQATAAAANAALTKAKTVQTLVTAEYGATQGAAQLAAIPHLAPVADAILEGAGFTPSNPIPDTGGQGIHAPVPGQLPIQVPNKTTMPQNTHPEFPAHPDVGVDRGIEGGQQ